MTIQQKITLLKLAFDGYFQQPDTAKQDASESIFALTDEIHEYIEQQIPESDRIWCLSITAEIKDFAEKCFRNPSLTQENFELETLMMTLIRVGYIEPKK